MISTRRGAAELAGAGLAWELGARLRAVCKAPAWAGPVELVSAALARVVGALEWAPVVSDRPVWPELARAHAASGWLPEWASARPESGSLLAWARVRLESGSRLAWVQVLLESASRLA